MGWGRRSALDDVFKEIAVMKLVDHPNILRLHEVLDDDETGNIYIVLDLMAHGSCEPQEHGLEPQGHALEAQEHGLGPQ